MNPSKAVAMLAPGSMDLSKPNVTGGVPAITPEDVCFAIGRIKDRATQALLLWKWAGHDDKAYLTEILILDRVVEKLVLPNKWSHPKGWKKQREGGGFFLLLVRQALHESSKPKVCRPCGGNGTRLYTGKPITCEKCEGSGHIHYSERARARAVHLDQKSWLLSWARRYREVQALIENIERSGLKVVYESLG